MSRVCSGLLSVVLFSVAFSIATAARGADSLESSLDEIARTIIERTRSGDGSTIAISTFTHSDGTCSEVSNFISEFVVDSLFNIGDGRVRIVERSQLSAIFKEMQLLYDGTIAPDTAKRIGEIEGVDALVTGSLTEFGDKVMLQARLIGTVDGTVFATARSSFPRTDTIQGMMAGRSRASCGFESAAVGSGTAVTNAGGFGSFEGDGFTATIVSFFYKVETGEASVSIRFNNTSENPIGVSVMTSALAATNGNGGTLVFKDGFSGMRSCGYDGSNIGYCTPKYPQHATTIAAGKTAQANFGLAGPTGVTPTAMSLAFEMVLTPNAAENREFQVVSVGFFEVQPVIR